MNLMRKLSKATAISLVGLVGAGCEEPQQQISHQQQQNNQPQQISDGDALTLLGLGLWGLGLDRNAPGGVEFGQEVVNAGLQRSNAEASGNKISQNVYVNNNAYIPPTDEDMIRNWRNLSLRDQMNLASKNRLNFSFVYTDMFDKNRDGLVEPDEFEDNYLSNDGKHRTYSKDGPIVVGFTSFGENGETCEIKHLNPTGMSRSYYLRINRDSYVVKQPIDERDKYIGKHFVDFIYEKRPVQTIAFEIR